MTMDDIFGLAQWAVGILLAIVFIGMGVNHFRRGPAEIIATMMQVALIGLCVFVAV